MTSYRESGVDQDAADALVPIFAKHAARTRRLEVAGDVGGFAGLFSLADLAERGYDRPALVVSTDGVGTKVELLREAGQHRTAGWDAVAMNADDVVCAGAEPLVFVDYVSIEKLDPDVVAEIVAGVADGCVEAGCALLGGETSQHPGAMLPGGYDVVGTCVGVVDVDRVWGPDRVRAGDDVVALASNGLHANGYALVRRLLEASGASAGDELLAPTAIYARKVLALAEQVEIHAAAHVTGGGIPGNLARALPDGLGATVELSSWERPPVFDRLAEQGVSEDELRSTFNLGAGMLVLTPDGSSAVAVLSDLGVSAWVAGRVAAGSGVELG
ncbi:MAG: phosphoribosylformylglycinamidine cyclo-ligase [Actinomycetota bacterium]